MNFNRPNPADFSLVERTILRALAVDHYDFTPTAREKKSSPNASYARPA